MAQNRLSGPGLNLPFPQALYPTSLTGAAPTPATNELTLAAGQALTIPGGDWALNLGKYTLIQYLDPITGIWVGTSGELGTQFIHSDGQNIRIANLTGCPIGAVITNAGTNYVQASTTVSPSAGGSLWSAIVGGALNTSLSITSAGSGYTVPPLVLIPAPTNTALTYPGVQATAYASISSGTVSGITIASQGAGYLSAPSVTLLPSPYDPNYGSIVNATAVSTLTGSGTVTAVLCTNNGAPQSSAPTLTIAGVGASAAATATMCWTATGASVTAGGAGYTTSTEVTSLGGRSAATPVYTNPAIEAQILNPRPAAMSVAVSGTSITSIGTVYDGGLYAGTPTTLVLTNAVATTAATLVLTLGSTSDTSYIQPL
jgi:hypothetical protein